MAWLLLGKCGEPGSCDAPGHMVREGAGRGMVALPAMQGRNVVSPLCDTEEAGLSTVRLL